MEKATIVDGKFDDSGAAREFAHAFREYGVDAEALPTADAVARLRERPALAVTIAAALDDWVEARRRSLGKSDPGWKALVSVAQGVDPDPLRDRVRALWGQRVTPESLAEFGQLAERPRSTSRPRRR